MIPVSEESHDYCMIILTIYRIWRSSLILLSFDYSPYKFCPGPFEGCLETSEHFQVLMMHTRLLNGAERRRERMEGEARYKPGRRLLILFRLLPKEPLFPLGNS